MFLQKMEKIKFFLISRLVWRLFPYLKNRMILRFSVVEQTTAWQFINVFPYLKTSDEKAAMFEQLLDEYRHADMFASLYQDRQAEAATIPAQPIRELFSPQQSLWKFLVYAHIGESGAVETFKNILRCSDDVEFNLCLKKILGDEEAHEVSVQEMLKNYDISSEEYSEICSWINQKRNRDSWTQILIKIVEPVVIGVMACFYFLTGIFLFWPAKRRMRQRVMRPDDAIQFLNFKGN